MYPCYHDNTQQPTYILLLVGLVLAGFAVRWPLLLLIVRTGLDVKNNNNNYCTGRDSMEILGA